MLKNVWVDWALETLAHYLIWKNKFQELPDVSLIITEKIILWSICIFVIFKTHWMSLIMMFNFEIYKNATNTDFFLVHTNKYYNVVSLNLNADWSWSSRWPTIIWDKLTLIPTVLQSEAVLMHIYNQRIRSYTPFQQRLLCASYTIHIYLSCFNNL